jgi:transcriptional regulator with XRE-family HTH domain
MKKNIRYSNEPLGKITVIPDFLPPITELNFKMKINEKIRILRKEKNWTQEEMAEKLGMSILGYAKVERGETDYQSNMENYLSKLAKIADVLNVDLEELMAQGDKPIYLIGGGDNSGSNNVVIGSPAELAFEIQKLQLLIKNKELEISHAQQMLEQKDKEIAMQQRENENLREIMALLKNK